MRTEIPCMVKNILLVMDIDRAVILSSFDKDSITQIEQYMKIEFTAGDKIRPNDDIKDYLGKFVGRQKEFALSYGHKLMINAMVRACQDIRKCKESTTTNQSTDVIEGTGSGSLTQEAALELKDEIVGCFFDRYVAGLATILL